MNIKIEEVLFTALGMIIAIICIVVTHEIVRCIKKVHRRKWTALGTLAEPPDFVLEKDDFTSYKVPNDECEEGKDRLFVKVNLNPEKANIIFIKQKGD